MKKFLILAFIFISFSQTKKSHSQEILVNSRGDSIVIYANGTWDYYENHISEQDDPVAIPLNPAEFNKPRSARSKISGMNNAYEIWYDKEVWRRIPPAEINPEADIALQMISRDVYVMIIYEELEIPVEYLSDIAIENALSVTPDMQMINKEYRIVNNDSVVFMQMNGTIQGIKIAYYSYYFSNENGSIQFHTFTGQKLLDKYKVAMNELLNGLVIKE